MKYQPSYTSVDSVVFRRVSDQYGERYEKFAEIAPWNHPGNTTAGCAEKMVDFLLAFEAMSGTEAIEAIHRGRAFRRKEARPMRTSRELEELARKDRNER
jgi:hypothetical protein